MNTRPFGRDGIGVSEVGLGTWQLGGDCWGDVSSHDAIQTLAAAVGQGVTFIDTADVYGAGRSEQLIGRFLKTRGSEGLWVATKVGRFPDPGWPKNFSYECFRQHTENSLRRLGVDAIDLTQLHSIPTHYYQSSDVFDWLARLQQQGKIKRIGASVESMDEAKICLEHPNLDSLQIIFNVFRQKPIGELFEQAKAKGVALIVRLPLASGLLADTIDRRRAFASNDHRRFNRDGQRFNVGETFAGLPLETGLGLVERLRSLVPAGMTMAQMALRWILDFDAVRVVIPGARSPQQARDNAAVSGMRALSPQLHADLKQFYEDHVAQHIRGPY